MSATTIHSSWMPSNRGGDGDATGHVSDQPQVPPGADCGPPLVEGDRVQADKGRAVALVKRIRLPSRLFFWTRFSSWMHAITSCRYRLIQPAEVVAEAAKGGERSRP